MCYANAAMCGLVFNVSDVLLQTCPLVECWQLQCHVGLLERGSSVILKVRSRVWAETFIEVSGLARVHGALALPPGSPAAVMCFYTDAVATLRGITTDAIGINTSGADLI